MKLNSTQKIGMFVLLILIALFFVINFLKGSDLFSSSNNYYTYLPEVDGLTATSPVYIRGLKVGSIDKITFDPVDNKFLVKLSVKREYQIPIDSKAEVYSSDLLGGKSLRLSLGNEMIEAKNKDTLVGQIVPDLISSLTSQVGPTKDKVDELLDNINQTVVSLNAVLDESTQQNLRSAISRLNNSLANIEQLSRDLKSVSPDLSSSIGNINKLTTSLSDPNGSLQVALNNLSETTKKLSSVDLASTINNIDNLITQIKSPSSTTGKLLTTDQLHNQLESLISELNNLVKKIEENPKKYLKLSVF